ncbi:hypothetical protein RS130_02350 [Paraglaciecola aquimarina]|uniref:C-type lysozyme inhibitor domain-containing protein n=1 Tax=Paraglaciecola aquimarina TaxID=1235557 RepID=A0ABU3SSB9_9ALTE|nr:hypothetical protein [Paraglaciecola aquimarina]MDU0352916.1 hypothetical protein [Paraglaciecola aquimarina]
MFSSLSNRFCILLLIVTGQACNQSQPPLAATDITQTIEPSLKAMRSTLDGETRIINVKLGNDITVAYDTKSSALFKLWQGDLSLSGAVFDQKHGPQPTVRGQTFIENGTGTMVC